MTSSARASTVTIAFPDRVKGGAHDTAHRKVVLPLLLDELAAAGVRPEDTRLVCAIGLHRKNHRHEFEDYLGREVLDRVPADNIVNHDAEDPDGMADLGLSELGDPVQVNSAVVESDLTVLVGHAAGNPYGGFSGGYKMPATGLTSWRSIASHHAPRSLYRDDFVPVSARSRFRDQLTSIGQAMEARMPQPFFSVDAVLDSQSRQLGVRAGRIADVEQATWPLAGRRTDLEVDGEPADVLLVGVPRNFHYGPGMGSNPILMMQAIGSSLVRAKRALVDRPIVIAAAICDGGSTAAEFPPYEAAFELLQSCQHPADMVAAPGGAGDRPGLGGPLPAPLRLPPVPRVLDDLRRRHRPRPLERGVRRRRQAARPRPSDGCAHHGHRRGGAARGDRLDRPRRRACSPYPPCRSRRSTSPPRPATPSDARPQLVEQRAPASDQSRPPCGGAAVRRTATTAGRAASASERSVETTLWRRPRVRRTAVWSRLSVRSAHCSTTLW